jgi:hypothetical protein
MSNEIERAFAALSEDAMYAVPDPAQTVRRRSDRRRRSQAIAGMAAAAVLVTGVTVGARVVMAGPDRSGPVPAVSPTAPASPTTTPATPSPSTPPSTPQSTAPSTTPPSSAPATVPTSIPARAFLQKPDMPGKLTQPAERLDITKFPLVSVCGKTYDKPAVRAAQRFYLRSADSPAESTPKTQVQQNIMVYQGDGAEAFMADLRAAVRACPTEKDEVGVPVKHLLRGSAGAGDESALIERTRPTYEENGEPAADGSTSSTFWVVVRVGDTVTFVVNLGWEGIEAERADTVQLGRKAAARLAAWR